VSRGHISRLKPLRKACVLFAVVVSAAACAGTAGPSARPTAPVPSSPATPPVTSSVTASATGPALAYRETGTASWYGREFQGRKTASGEVFDMNGLTAAHRTLPLGTVIRVTNLENGKNVTVTINDRGPFIQNCVLDVSYAAARELDFIAQGTTRVQIDLLKRGSEPSQYTVNAASFTEEENARLLKFRLSKKFEVVTIVPFETNIARFYRVQVGSYSSEEFAEHVAAKLTREGLEPVVLRKD
jgi:rare lipoprotein A